ncbi:MAG: MBOAT family O-acyltransferase [Clostridia bacterium]
MLFSTVFFLFIFLPIVLSIYFIVPSKFKNLVLFISSLIFYAWGEPIYVCIMIFSTILDYTIGMLINKNDKNETKRKLLLLTSVIINIGMLGIFKYSDFFISNINNIFKFNISLINLPLPIGISFYTFQTLSYTIDVYRRKIDVQKNIISFGTYVALFPQLIAGPIVRYATISKEINERKVTSSLFADGIIRFIEGLGKKVLIANSVGQIWSVIKASGISNMPVITAWFGIICFALQIYFDFSGYSDMAIGLGKMFGFNFDENFNYPYISTSITDFWRRWHISLSTWFKEYIYIPLRR